MRKFATIVSFVLNPLFIAYLVPFLITYKYTDSGWYALKWTLFISLFVVLGMSYLFYGRLKGYFSDFDISKRTERFRFYRLIFILSLVFLFISVFLKGYAFPLSILAFGITLGIFAYAIVNLRIKASGHVGVLCAFIIVVGFLYGIQSALLLSWTIPLLAWSRLYLKRHTMYEVIAGVALGSIITLITFFIGKVVYSI